MYERWQNLRTSQRIMDSNEGTLLRYLFAFESSWDALTDSMTYRGNFTLVNPAYGDLLLHLHNFSASVTSLLDHTCVLANAETDSSLQTTVCENLGALKASPPVDFMRRFRNFLHHHRLPVIASSFKTSGAGIQGTLHLYQLPMRTTKGFHLTANAKAYLATKPDPFPLRDAILDCSLWVHETFSMLFDAAEAVHSEVLSDWSRVCREFQDSIYGENGATD